MCKDVLVWCENVRKSSKEAPNSTKPQKVKVGDGSGENFLENFQNPLKACQRWQARKKIQ